ncbi:MAG: nucleotide exchange factor GrpE [Candidatus Eisenbacteria bacterium]|nr:nucleotide exchange factor GrpE [Candidatus Eisenbacteria bacterium]
MRQAHRPGRLFRPGHREDVLRQARGGSGGEGGRDQVTFPNDADREEDGRRDARNGGNAPGAGEQESTDLSETAAADIAALRDELEELNTKWLRALADLENYKRRVERERRRWSREAKEEVILPLLEVIDNFERAVACDVPNAPEPDDPFRQGVEMILKHLKSVLAAQGVEPIEACGARFDPNIHEAVQQVESDEHESEEIVSELQRGYTMGDRLLRCSRVVVAK